MTDSSARRRGIRGWHLVLVVICLLPSLIREVRGQAGKAARQVTVFGILATPNSNRIDPKLESIAPQLRELLPDHGFKLIDTQTKRLTAGRAVTCKLPGGLTTSTTLVEALDDDGKVQLRNEILLKNVSQLATDVATPPNQLFFLDKMLNNGSHMLIGIGAR